MLQLILPEGEFFNDETEEFIVTKACVLKLEHSLISISKWESRWKLSFLNTTEKTTNQSIDYIRCMTLNPPEDDKVYLSITNKQMELINAYIADDMTATWFKKELKTPGGIKGNIITSELIYYWMDSHQISWEAQKWHLNRLMTLIKVHTVKAEEAEAKSKKKRTPANEIVTRNRALNEQRRQALGSKG